MSIAPFRESRAPAPAPAAPEPSAPLASSGTSSGDHDAGPSPFARLLLALGDEATRGEAQMRSAMGAAHGGAGRDFAPGELLALQAGVYRYSEAVDLASKLVDRATSGVKTVVQGQ
jgi:hypothetical protein